MTDIMVPGMGKFLKKASPYWAALVPVVALAAAGLRWLSQGSSNVYTDVDRRFYVPDEATGWASSETGAVWLGLDSLAVIAAFAVAAVAASWIIRRRESKRERTWTSARYALWPAVAMTLLVPAWAVASGGRPSGGKDFLPAGLAQAPADGINGRIEGAPKGTYRVVANGKSVVAVRLHAGGEEFEARFAGGLKGSWRGNPGDLTQPMSAEIEVAANSVDTGISKRSEHATEFLKVGKHPKVKFSLGNIAAAEADDRGRIRFAAKGSLQLMGATTTVKVTGLMWSPKGAALTRLGMTGPTLVISAGFSFDMNDTPLNSDMDSFDRSTAPVAVTLVLALDQGTKGDRT